MDVTEAPRLGTRASRRVRAARPAAAVPGPAPRWSSLLAGLTGLVALALVALAHRGRASAPPPSDAESALAARALAIGRDGLGQVADAWHGDTAAALQIATYGLWRTVVGPVGALVQAREAVIGAAIVTGALVWVLSRRLGLTLPASALAGLLATLTPFALTAHRLVDPANLAAPWLVGGFLLSTPLVRRRWAAVPVTVCLLVAVVTTPVAGLVVLAGLAPLVAAGDVAARLGRTARTAVVVGLGVAAAVVALALTGVLGSALALPTGAPTPDARLVDVVFGAAAVAVAALAAIPVRWLRPFAVVFLVLVAVALVDGPVRTPALLLAVPAAGILVGAGADAATRRWSAREDARRGRQLAALATVVVLAVAGLAVLATPSPGREDTGPARAVAWIEANAADATIVADAAVWSELLRKRFPRDRLVSSSDLGSSDLAADERVRAALAGVDDAAPVFVVGRPADSRASLTALARAADASAVPCAVFGTTTVRWVVDDVRDAREAARQEAAQRVEAGRALAGNENLTLLGDADRALRAGEVDPRLLTALATFVSRYTLTVDAFDRSPGDTGPFALRRTARITSVNDSPVSPGGPSTDILRRWMTTQIPPFRPDAVRVDGDTASLTLHYTAPTPTGLLPG